MSDLAGPPDVCEYIRQVAPRHRSLKALAESVHEALGIELSISALRSRYDRWRARTNAPGLKVLLGRGPVSDFGDEPTRPGAVPPLAFSADTLEFDVPPQSWFGQLMAGGENPRGDKRARIPRAGYDGPTRRSTTVESDRDPKPDNVPEPTVSDLESCLQWGTLLERQAVECFIQYGNLAETAEAMGMPVRMLRGIFGELQSKAARRGWSPGSQMTKPVPDGFHVKGVSTFYDADGNLKGQWVKSQADQEHKLQALMDAMQLMVEPFKGLSDPAPAPRGADSDLLCVYPMGDPHLGMHAWAQETGQNFDLAIAESNLVAAVDHLVALAPPAREALIINLGDFFHSDNSAHVTARSGHALDVDTRWSKVLGVGIRTMRRIIDRALLKHEKVTVICEIGNHDDHSSVFLALCLSQFYEREPRVVIDTSPSKFHWYRFGANLIGTTHGDTIKLAALGGVMAADRAADWGATEHRYWYCGHVHHDRAVELPGCIVETFRTLAPKDAWHAGQGYRAGHDMKCDVLHRQWGRVNRHIVGIRQLWNGGASDGQ